MVDAASTLALGTLGIAVALVVVNPLWKAVALPFVVLVEQAGHVLVALVTLRWVSSVKLDRGARGTFGTTTRFRPLDKDRFKPALIPFYLGGYVAPPLTGLLLARAIDRGWDPAPVILTLFVVLAVLGAFHSGGYTILVISVFAAALLGLYWTGDGRAQWFAVVILAWVLLVGGIRRGLHLVDIRTDTATDASALQRETRLPQELWIAFFLLVAVASLVTGARWLLASA